MVVALLIYLKDKESSEDETIVWRKMYYLKIVSQSELRKLQLEQNPVLF